MADTARTLAALQTLLANNTSGDITPQKVRDFLVSVFGLTTVGDLLGIAADGVQARLPVGADDEMLVADSGETLGLKWAAQPSYLFYISLGSAEDGSAVTP